MSQRVGKFVQPNRGWGSFALRAIAVTLVMASLAFAAIWSTSSGSSRSRAFPAQSSSLEAPVDAPHLPRVELQRPPPPASFSQVDEGWIRFDYPPDVRQRLQPLIDHVAEIRDEFRERLGNDVLGSVAVRVARTPAEMEALAPEGAPYPSYASGVAYAQIGLILLTAYPQNPAEDADLLEIFRHELAHVALYDAVKGNSVPRWFNEGFAIHLSRESSLTRVRTLWGATVAGKLIPIAALDRAFAADSTRVNLAYAESADLVRHLLRTRDSQRFVKMLREVSEGKAFAAALSDSFGLDLAGLELEWRDQVSQRYSIWPVLLSGSLLWVGTLALFALGWQRRRRRQQTVLDRWSLEEAAEDQLEEQARRAARLRIVLSPTLGDRVSNDDILPNSAVISNGNVAASANATSNSRAPTSTAIGSSVAGESQVVIAGSERLNQRVNPGAVPKVEHDGNWHTLH